jgi:hypothetical protein
MDAARHRRCDRLPVTSVARTDRAFLVSLAALAALAFGFVLVPYALIRAASHRWHGRSAAPRTAVVATFREEYVS